MAKIIGNGGGSGGMNASSSGAGIARQRVPFGRLTVVADADGDIIRIPISALIVKNAQIFQGVFAQSEGPTGATVQIDTTLAEPELACNPAQDSIASGEQGKWHPDTTLAVGTTISKLSIPCPTAIRVTFAKKGTILYLAGV
jgi:hypothetical protein